MLSSLARSEPASLKRRLCHGERRPASASSRFSQTVSVSITEGFWNLRPMPRLAIAASSYWVRSIVPLKNTSPESGRVLPVMMSIIVLLPAPFGPMMARSSPSRSTSDRLLMALKPSKLTQTPFRYSTLSVGICRSTMTGLRHRGRLCRLVGPFLFELTVQSDNALGQIQRGDDKQRAEHEQPGIRDCAGKPGFGVVDQQRADNRTIERAAPANRDPDH